MSRDRVGAAIDRLHDAQDLLNSCTWIRTDRVDREDGEGPLAGMPIVVKDLIDQAGLPTTCGSGFLRDPAVGNAPVIDRLLEAGSVLVGRANLHEFAYGFSSENPWFGPVRNPRDPATSPGGSSGGSAVAVAAGLVPAAIGTDTGGSVRVPAALTGIYGLKVTHGRVPVAGVFPLAPSLDTVGPLSRDAATLDLVYRALAGLGGTAAPHPMEGVRVGLPEQWLDCPDLDALTRQEFDQTASALEKAGAELVRIDDPVLVPWGMIQELAGAEAAASHRAFRAAGRPYGAEVSDRLDKAETVTMEEYISAHRWRTTLVEAFARAFHIVDVLATPAVASRRKVIGDDRINGSHYRPVLSWFSALVNHAGAPAIAIPWLGRESGSRADGSRPPFSLQLVAPPWQEDRLLGLARSLEEAGMAGFTRPPVYLE